MSDSDDLMLLWRFWVHGWQWQAGGQKKSRGEWKKRFWKARLMLH
jgi:hypothetical protein